MTRKEFSYGIIPIRKKGATFEILLIQHVGGHWSFPKGHPEKHETPLKTATRELREETGLEIIKVRESHELSERYFFTWKGEKINKTVIYFLAEVTGELTIDPVEVKDAKWLSLEDAYGLATFSEAKRLCLEVTTLL